MDLGEGEESTGETVAHAIPLRRQEQGGGGGLVAAERVLPSHADGAAEGRKGVKARRRLSLQEAGGQCAQAGGVYPRLGHGLGKGVHLPRGAETGIGMGVSGGLLPPQRGYGVPPRGENSGIPELPQIHELLPCAGEIWLAGVGRCTVQKSQGGQAVTGQQDAVQRGGIRGA